MKAVILAGGEATRLRPLTCNTPKIMVPVLNRPFLEHVIGYLKQHGIGEVILAVGGVPAQVESYFGEGSELGVHIAYSTEDSPLGTAGAVKNAEALLDDSFLVFNGDIFTDLDLTAMMRQHRQSKVMATLALTPVDDPTVYGVVETDSRGMVTRFVEKPSPDKVTTNMINAGIYILQPDILHHIPPDAFCMFERDVFPTLLESGTTIFSYPAHGYWIDIGTPEKYLRLQHDLLRNPRERDVEFEGEGYVHASARIEGPVVIGKGCSIGRGCTIQGPAVLGAGCRIEEDALIEGAVLWQDCRIRKETRLKNCLVASRCDIGDASEVLDGCILGDDVLIGNNNKLCKGIRIWPGKAIEPGAISF